MDHTADLHSTCSETTYITKRPPGERKQHILFKNHFTLVNYFQLTKISADFEQETDVFRGHWESANHSNCLNLYWLGIKKKKKRRGSKQILQAWKKENQRVRETEKERVGWEDKCVPQLFWWVFHYISEMDWAGKRASFQTARRGRNDL